MTASSLTTKTIALVDETVALRRCALYYNEFRGTAISYPAALLRYNAVANWIRRHRVAVDVTTADELDRAASAGVDPLRIVVHRRDGDAAAVRRAADAGVGTFVISSIQQIAIPAGDAERIHRVLIDVTAQSADALASQMLTHKRLRLTGLQCRLDDPDDPIGAVKLRRLIAAMARIRSEQGVVLSRVSLTDLDFGPWCRELRVLRRIGEAMGEVIGEACAHHRFPRPALTVAPGRAALLPATASSAV